ncbi:MAG TPA: P-loop NTPase [Candidatus Hydrogenedentes bacterium]|nr:P-loop NTPase [Candidatus Hydrogenedentota bacterium]HPU97609.1 P-loop NTPase [Candidatus Hydrogenedentota bacterium]
MISREKILETLSAIIDPDFGKDIVSLGFIKDIQIDGEDVKVTIELTTPACPVRDRFREQAEKLLRDLEGIRNVQVHMTAKQNVSRAAAMPALSLEGVETIIAVSSCKGGVGKSTVAAFLARAMQREGLRVGLLDADIHGPSIPTLMRTLHAEVASIGEKILPVEVDGLATMSLGYLIGDRPAIMRGPMVSNYVFQLIANTEWGNLDYLIIDMPPGTGDIQLTLIQRLAFDGAVIVTTPQTLSLVDVARGILMFERVNVPVLGVVENMAWFDCDQCGKRHYPFGHSAAALQHRFGVKTLVSLPITAGLQHAANRDAGKEITAFAELADAVHRAVGTRRIAGQQLPQVSSEPGFIVISWPDGEVTRLPARLVRLSCQCALCVDEFSGEQILDPEQIPEDVTATEITPLGNYAVGITWSDGHSSGIYSWEHLREITQKCAVTGCNCGGVWREDANQSS